MSLSSQDEVFLHALKKNPIQRDQQDLEIIFSRLHRFEALCNLREQKLRSLAAQVRYEQHSANEILYGKDDPCTCWFILLSGSIFIQGSMFLRNTSFGKRIPGMKLRGTQCLVLEKSEMIVIEYPDDQTAMIIGNQQNSETLNQGSPLKVPAPNAVTEDECNNVEASPNRPSRARRIKLAHEQGLVSQAELQITYRQSWDSSQGSEFVSQENLKVDDMEEGESIDDIEEQDDSISLHSSSSVIKDLVIDALKKDLSERNEDDNDTLFEFTRSLQAFSNMTESTRRDLCKFMVFAQADKLDTILLQDNELLDSWSVIINGSVLVVYPDSEEEKILGMGDSFGVEPHMGQQRHKGTMYTMVDECQFVCIAQAHYFEVLAQGKENMDFIYSDDGTLEMVKEKREADGGRTSNIVIRSLRPTDSVLEGMYYVTHNTVEYLSGIIQSGGYQLQVHGIPTSLHLHLLEENATDNTYAEDFLLTYRAFWNEPRKICELLLDWFGDDKYKPKITRVILLWVNNHFNDFEEDVYMMELLERFEEKLRLSSKSGECRLFNIACSTKAKSRVVKITRSSVSKDLGISLMGGIHGYPIYVSNVTQNSLAMEKGVKRGDQLLNVNGQNFEKLEKDKAEAILKKNTDLTLTVKTNLFAFKAMMSEMRNPGAFLKSKSNDDMPISQSSTLQVPKMSKFSTFTSETDLYDGKGKKAGTLGRRALDKVNKVRSKMFSWKKEQSYKEYFEQHGGRVISEESYGAKDDSFLRESSHMSTAATIDGPKAFKQSATLSSSNPDLLAAGSSSRQDPHSTDYPEDVIKVFKADQTFRFVFVNHDTTAEEAIKSACKEFGIGGDNYKNFSLCRVSVQNETFVKQSKLPEKWSNLSNIPLNARYYLKNDMESEQLMPDENIPDLLKEANYSFLDLDCFEVALQLTIQDYELFRTVEQTDFIDDLFKLNENRLKGFRDFENLVNTELFWVVSTICMEPNSLRRSKMIKHFTKIAHHCKSLKNLNSTFAIISGLGYRAVSRMRSSWEKVPMKIQRTFEDLQALMDPSRNMSKYRTLLSDCSSQPPVIPYIPVIKKDLTFIHLGNDTKVDGLVNFEKMRMMGREVRNVCRLCSAESSQIFASSSSANSDADRSNIYQTLTRKNRRASFGNARKMHEEAVNARRVKQYMSHLVIVNDEEKLMEMSKQVEPVAVSSTHLKRKTEKTDSPSRSSKTLPHGASLSKAHSQARNNSEPHIYAPTGMVTQPARKKTPSSSLPKFGTSSPQAIKKLLALSEESDGGPQPHIGGKINSREGHAESMGSQDLSSSHSSPSMQSRHEMLISKGSMSSSESMHSLAYENNNHSNNKAMHRRRDYDPTLPASHPHRSSQGDYSSSSQSHGSQFRKSDQSKFSQVPHNVHRKTSNRSHVEKQNIKGSRESLNSRTSLDDQVDGKKRHHRKKDSELSRSGMYSSSSSIDSTQKSQTSETTDEETKQAFLYGSRGVRDAPMTPEKHPSRNTAKEITSPYHQNRMQARLFDIEQQQQKKLPGYQDVHGYYEHMKTQWNSYLQSPVEHFHPQMSRRNTTGHLSAENHQRSRTGDVIDQQGKYPYYRKNSAPIIHEEQFEKKPTFFYPGHDPAQFQYLYSGKRMEFADHERVSPHAMKSPNFQSFRNKNEEGVDYGQNFINDGQRQVFPNRMKKELPHISECAEGAPRNFTRAASSQNQRPHTSPISAYSTSHSVPSTPSTDSQYLFLDRGNQRYDLHQNVSDYHRHFMPSPLVNHRSYVSRPHNLPLQQSNPSGMRQYSFGENEHMKLLGHTPTTPTRNDRVMMNMGYSSPIEPQIPMTQTFYNPHSMGYYNSNNNNEFTSTSSPQKQSLKPTSTSRRKSQEWSVTDLDKENQQFAMQVWTSRSTTSTNHTGHYQRQSRDGSGLQQLAEDLEIINHRLGATDISPSPSSKSNEAAKDAEVNGKSDEQSQSFEGMAEKKRTPPTYNEALGHVSELPSYEDLETVKDNRELSSHV